jgi:LmbE family N-acetylglucosaminyl deacetylase
MIVPQVGESAWRARLDGVEAWQPPLMPTLVVSPHPDDETLGAGGLISWLRARGVPVTVVAVTDGERAYEGVTGLGPVREREQTAALVRLGVHPERVLRLRLPDSDVTAHEQRLRECLAEVVRPLVAEGLHVIAPWRGDFHPDHEACGRAAEAVAAETGARLTSYFFWTWHRGTTETVSGLPLVRFRLGEDERFAKHEALRCHRSQLSRPDGEPILPDYLLEPAYRPYEVYLPWL